MGKYKNYTLGEPLGRGGQAEVFEAVDKRSGKLVALKRVKYRNKYDLPEALARMKHEIDVQTSVRHPHVMPIFESDPHFHWYTMPRAVRVLGQLTPPIAEQMLFEIVEHSAKGLAAAHQENNIHRDVTPNNIIQLFENDVPRWVVADWGLVRQHGRTTVVRTIAHGTFGTEGFAAPELWDEPHMASSPADVYSLGRVVAWCLTGIWPGPNLPIPNIPPRWTNFVSATTAITLEERVESMDVVLDLLEQTKNWSGDKYHAPRVVDRIERFQPYFKPLRLYLWNNGSLREVPLAELADVSKGAYGNHRKLSHAPWSLVENGDAPKSRRLTDRGIRFVQGQLRIPLRIAKDVSSEECFPAPDGDMILFTEV